METSEKVVLREQPEIKDLLQTLMKQGLKKEQRRSYPIVLTSIQILRMVYETRADASSRMSADQISDVALSLEYVKQYSEAHKELNYKQVYLLEQCVVWQRLSVHLGWQCDNVRASARLPPTKPRSAGLSRVSGQVVGIEGSGCFGWSGSDKHLLRQRVPLCQPGFRTK